MKTMDVSSDETLKIPLGVYKAVFHFKKLKHYIQIQTVFILDCCDMKKEIVETEEY